MNLENKPTFHMLIGPPCSGKSTWVYNYLTTVDKTKLPIVFSTDHIIESAAKATGKNYSDVFPDIINPAQKIVNASIQLMSFSKESMILDQTNTTKKSRKTKLQLLKNKKDYHIVAVYFDAPYTVLLERLKKRNESAGKVISESVLEHMYAQLQPPSEYEGFDEIIFVETKEESASE